MVTLVRSSFPFTLFPYLETYHPFFDRSFFWSKGKWWIALRESRVEVAEVREKKEGGSTLLEITLESEETMKELSSLLGLNENPLPFYRLGEKDPVMREIIEEFYGARIPRSRSLFEAAITTILEQQISMKVASALRKRLVEKWGQGPLYQEGETIFAFPTPRDIAEISPTELRKIGMSGAKAQTIHRLAKMIEEKKIDPASWKELPSPQVVDFLTNLPGIGLWSAQFIVARWMPANDCFAPSDLGLRKAIAFFYRGSDIPVSTTDAQEILKRFSPYERWAGWYLLMAIEKEKNSFSLTHQQVQ
ncbi:MAG: DNA-3-methyladenine glycosylase [Candidatus Atribacteria bacterium]|nr:DNA-3-methyladenine glycosylase [Candidatus Atribacteria bacterium]